MSFQALGFLSSHFGKRGRNLKRRAAVVLLTVVTAVLLRLVPAVAGDHPRPIRVLADQKPATLDPRLALDAAGQRLGSLLFRALVRIEADLGPVPDLASGWKVEDGGKRWVFKLREGLKDHAGAAISAADMAGCLESYRVGEPASRLRGSFPSWVATRADSARGQVVLELSAPDPYLERNLTLLRFFRVDSVSEPCVAGRGVWVGTGPYRLDAPRPFSAPVFEDGPLRLLPVPVDGQLDPSAPELHFTLVRDDGTRALKLIRGDVDVAQNVLSLTKTRWIADRFSDRLSIVERQGVNVSYLAFNLRHPILADKRVRQALARAIDREAFVRHKMQGFGTVAGSLLAAGLPESRQSALPDRIAYAPAEAERLLDQAGYPRKEGGVRFRLRYKTTSVREGIETALVFQDQWRRIGVGIELDVVEPAVFLQAARRGSFEMYSSRWIGVSDGGILARTLKTGAKDNRVGYSSAEVDAWLDAAARETDPARRVEWLGRVQDRMAEDLPYFPLWTWDNALVANRDLRGLDASSLSRSGALGPLAKLRWKPKQP